MRRKGPWSADRIERFLREAKLPVRLACNGESGHPVVASLWFVALEGRLWCATQKSASIASHLARDPRCAFEISGDAAPYCGVRGQGVVRLDEARGEEILRILLRRYLGDSPSPLASWLLARAEREVALAIEPRSMISWDYTSRMTAAA
jgi:hypothetical protein